MKTDISNIAVEGLSVIIEMKLPEGRADKRHYTQSANYVACAGVSLN